MPLAPRLIVSVLILVAQLAILIHPATTLPAQAATRETGSSAFAPTPPPASISIAMVDIRPGAVRPAPAVETAYAFTVANQRSVVLNSASDRGARHAARSMPGFHPPGLFDRLPTRYRAQDPPEGEEPDSAATDEPAEPEPATAPGIEAVERDADAVSEQIRTPRSPLWIWTGTAAVVGLFIVGLSYDLSHDDSPAERPELPWFPNTP